MSSKRKAGEKDISYLRNLPEAAVEHLWVKIVETSSADDRGCMIDHGGAASEAYPRHVINSLTAGKLLPKGSYFPYKFQANHIALLHSGRPPPNDPPPAPPQWPEKTAKVWRWVASHLCHQSRCVLGDHLVWEPDWMNRGRDYCIGQQECPNCKHSWNTCQHDPKCIASHKTNYARALKKAKLTQESDEKK